MLSLMLMNKVQSSTLIYRLRAPLAPPVWTDHEAREALRYIRTLGASHVSFDGRELLNSPHATTILRHQAALAHAMELGVYIDVVPGYLNLSENNHLVQEVLSHGIASEKARLFDITWHDDGEKNDHRPKLILPLLNEHYGQEVLHGKLIIVAHGQRLFAAYGAEKFALAPDSYSEVKKCLHMNEATVDFGEGPLVLVPTAVHHILSLQHFSLVHRHIAASKLNIRRMLGQSHLWSLSNDSLSAFRVAHGPFVHLLTQTGIDGMMIHHAGAIGQPQRYVAFARGSGVPVVMIDEDIGFSQEEISSFTTTCGVQVADKLLAVLTYGPGLDRLQRVYSSYVRGSVGLNHHPIRARTAVLKHELAGDVWRVCLMLQRYAARSLPWHDMTATALKDGLRQLIARLPGARTLLWHDHEAGRRVLMDAAAQLRRECPRLPTTVIDFLCETLLNAGSNADDPQLRSLVYAFENLVWSSWRLGVGWRAANRRRVLWGNIDEDQTITLDGFHAWVASSLSSGAPPLLSTKGDHSFGTLAEDVALSDDQRLRLLTLAELPQEWQHTFHHLMRLLRAARRGTIVGREDVYLALQMSVVIWDKVASYGSTEAIAEYLVQVARAAGLHTSDLMPNKNYEHALLQLSTELLTDRRVARVVEPLARAVRLYGFIASISQLVLLLTLPGAALMSDLGDLFCTGLPCGTAPEPKNFAERSALLQQLEDLLAAPNPTVLRRSVELCDERMKMYVAACLMRARLRLSHFGAKIYRPLWAHGGRDQHAIAYVRGEGALSMVVWVPRFAALLDQQGGWNSTWATLPPDVAHRSFVELLSGKQLTLGDHLSPDQWPLPWAVLVSTN